MEAERVAFVSGKGGTGKSTTAVLLSGAMSDLRRKVLLLEIDSGLRSVDILAGVGEKTVYDMEDVLSGRCKPADALVQSPLYPGLWVVSASYSRKEFSSERLQLLCEKMSPFFHYIFLDAAAGIGSSCQMAVREANRVILVLTPDPVALRAGRRIVDDLEDPSQTVQLILNRVDKKRILREKLIRDLDEAIDTVGVPLLGVVPESNAIQRAVMESNPLPANKKEKMVYEAIASRILGHHEPLIVQ